MVTGSVFGLLTFPYRSQRDQHLLRHRGTRGQPRPQYPTHESIHFLGLNLAPSKAILQGGLHGHRCGILQKHQVLFSRAVRKDIGNILSRYKDNGEGFRVDPRYGGEPVSVHDMSWANVDVE